MFLTNEWYFWTGKLSDYECQIVIDSVEDEDWRSADIDLNAIITEEERVKGHKPNLGYDEAHRKAEVKWINDDRVHQMFWGFMEFANKEAGWNYDITGSEEGQLVVYREGGFHEWHYDGRGDHLSTYDTPDSPIYDGCVRKLSLTCQLSNPNDYEGGEFQIVGQGPDLGDYEIKTPPIQEQGSIIIFPSFKQHQVAPITKGTRHSYVTWYLGPPFK